MYLAVNEQIRATTWDLVREETSKDVQMSMLIPMIESVFPDDKGEMPPEIEKYWMLRDNLYVVDGVVLINDRIVAPASLHEEILQSGPDVRVVIPSSLQGEIVQSLHAAHQGVTALNERARAAVYWPGITKDIQTVRNTCSSCNKTAPSPARIPAVEPCIPTTPFEAIACDYFFYQGYYYLVAAERLSGWTEVQQIKMGTNEAGATGLCKALRKIFVTFGVPVEIASDGGQEFISQEAVDFFYRWGVYHRLSSVSLPSSNGRAGLSVKAVKRLLMDNIGPGGNLKNDKVTRTLLTQRNTPEPGCRLSPAQILFGRQLRDTLPQISKNVMSFNNDQFSKQWRDAWRLKEEAIKARYVKTLENLNEHLHFALVIMSLYKTNQVGSQKSGTKVELWSKQEYMISML